MSAPWQCAMVESRAVLAKEKCDTYAGGAKDRCLDQAKARFGR